MGKRDCPNCGAKLRDRKLIACPSCGHFVTKQRLSETGDGRIKILLAVLALLWIANRIVRYMAP